MCRLLVSRLPPCLYDKCVVLYKHKITWGIYIYIRQTAHRMFSIFGKFTCNQHGRWECNFTNKAESVFNRIGGCHEDYVLNHINLVFNSDTWRLSDFVHTKNMWAVGGGGGCLVIEIKPILSSSECEHTHTPTNCNWNWCRESAPVATIHSVYRENVSFLLIYTEFISSRELSCVLIWK